MRRAQPAIGLKAKGYHRFAWIVLGMAVMVAVAGNDAVPAGADSPVRTARSGTAAPGAAASPELEVPPALTELGESLPGDAVDAEAEPALVAETAEDEDRGHPPLPGEARTGPQQVRAAPPPRPSPAELDRLVASSRVRSGGVDQGDESRRSS